MLSTSGCKKSTVGVAEPGDYQLMTRLSGAVLSRDLLPSYMCTSAVQQNSPTFVDTRRVVQHSCLETIVGVTRMAFPLVWARYFIFLIDATASSMQIAWKIGDMICRPGSVSTLNIIPKFDIQSLINMVSNTVAVVFVAGYLLYVFKDSPSFPR